MNVYKIILFFLINVSISAQNIDFNIKVNADLIDQTNTQIFETLERSLNEFVNTTSWTDEDLPAHARVKADLLITVESYTDSRFNGNLQIQSSRPVFQSSYRTSVLNRKDDNFSFSYQEFESLNYNTSQFESNLVSLISFYVYLVLGLDQASFAPEGGLFYFEQAKKIVDYSQQTGFSGWRQSESRSNRYWLIDQLTSNSFADYRSALYQYHRLGLDIMHENSLETKQKIEESLESLNTLYSRQPNALVIQTFIDAKAEEIQLIYAEGPSYDNSNVVEILNRIAPFFASKWSMLN